MTEKEQLQERIKEQLKDYVQVNERVIAFYQQYPDGVLQSEIVELSEKRVVIKAYAYRSPSDLLPGVGHSMMMIPGLTSYTRNSEVENAETSAWGRALAALGFEVKRGIASQNEVDNKRDDGPDPADSFRATADKRVTDAQALSVRTWCRSEGVEFVATFGEIFDVKEPEQLTELQFARWVEKRRDIVESKRPKLSKDVDGAMKAVDESMNRVSQQSNGNYISEKQAKRFFAIAHGNQEVMKQVLDLFTIASDREIPKQLYDRVCAELEQIMATL
jgi:hypothetical protein